MVAGFIYQLAGPTFVGTDLGGASTGTGVTLTIQPGVTVAGVGLNSVLVVPRGNRLVADGTQAQPIIFTSGQDVGNPAATPTRAPFAGEADADPFTAEWGGIVINGRAPINTCNVAAQTATNFCQTEGEGGSGLYGGPLAADDSGTLRFVQVRYAGQIFSATNELNGIAFQGVGTGTDIEFLQVHNGADDGIEFFGGTVNSRFLVLTGADDDAFDFTFGFNGASQFVLIQHNQNLANTNTGIEADSQGSAPFTNNDALPRALPRLSNFTILGADVPVGTVSVSDIGALIRAGSGGRYANMVIARFPGGAIDIDGSSSFGQATSGALRFDSMFLANTPAFTSDTDNTSNNIAQFFSNTGANNGVGNVVGGTPSIATFINGPTEQAIAPFTQGSIDQFFINAPFIGAVNSALPFNASAPATSNWTSGWTFLLNPAPSCPANLTFEGSDPARANGTCVLSGEITQNTTLLASPNLRYELRGATFVGQDQGGAPAAPIVGAVPAILTVGPGVRIEAEQVTNSANTAVLVVRRGSQLVTLGTQAAPVVFTAEATPGFPAININSSVNLWGGLVLNGRAPINTCNGVFGGTNGADFCQTEGEGGSGLYGGNTVTDSSGALNFTRVEFAGQIFSATNELNGIAFQGTGSGTQVNFVQVHNNGDDGIEFFGGTTNARFLVVTGADDDSLDWTFGYNGAIQHAVTVHNPLQSNTNTGIEADSQGSTPFLNADALPRALPRLSNITLVGAPAPSTVSDIGALIRAGSGGQYANITIARFPGGGIDIDGSSSFAQAVAGALQFNSVFNTATPQFTSDSDNTSNNIGQFFSNTGATNGTNNSTGTSTLTGVGPNAADRPYINGANETAVPVTNPVPLDPTFTPAANIGGVLNGSAFNPTNPAASNWTLGWTVWLNQ